MYEAKIYNLGLSLLIRLNQSFKYLRFLGGEAQRPYQNNHGGALPAQYRFKPFDSNYIHKSSETLTITRKIRFLSPSRPFSLHRH